MSPDAVPGSRPGPSAALAPSAAALALLAGAVLVAPAESAGQERRNVCDSPECCRRADGAELYGRALSAGSGEALAGSTISVRIESPPDAGTAEEVETTTDDSGSYRLCGIPTPARVEARAERSGATSRSVSFRLDAPGRVELSFEIRGVPTGLDSLRKAAAAARANAAPGRIVGRIEDAESGRPVAEATLTLEPSGRRVLTDSRGRFSIPEAPAGQGELTIQHVGYGTQTVEVDVPAGLTVNLDVELPPEAIEVEPIDVRVEATIRSRHLEDEGFYRRMERGFGHFWSPERLERRNPARVSHVLQQTPGVELTRSCTTGRCIHIPYMSTAPRRATGSYSVTQKGKGGMRVIEDNRGFKVCAAQIYVDGRKVSLEGMGIDDFVNVQDLAAIEVYRGAAGMAPMFIDSNASCGVIALWTKRGPGPRSGGGQP